MYQGSDVLQNDHSNSNVVDNIQWFDIDRFFKQPEGTEPIFLLFSYSKPLSKNSI